MKNTALGNLKNTKFRTLIHDIANPLTAMQLNLSLLETSISVNPRTQEYIKRLWSGFNFLSDVVVTERSSINHFENISLQNEVNKVRLLLATQLLLSSVKLVNHIHDDSVIYCERAKVERIIVNLVVNGIDALKNCQKSKQKRIDIYMFSKLNSSEIIVKDNGCGIKEADQKRIFQKGFSTKASSGLGLALVKDFVTEMGWTIELQSKIGVGTTFIITIPKT